MPDGIARCSRVGEHKVRRRDHSLFLRSTRASAFSVRPEAFQATGCRRNSVPVGADAGRPRLVVRRREWHALGSEKGMSFSESTSSSDRYGLFQKTQVSRAGPGTRPRRHPPVLGKHRDAVRSSSGCARHEQQLTTAEPVPVDTRFGAGGARPGNRDPSPCVAGEMPGIIHGYSRGMRHRRCGCESRNFWLKMSVEVIWEPLKGLFQGGSGILRGHRQCVND